MSADGSVIVGASQGNFTSQAFRWTVATGMAGLGFLPGDTNSEAYAVSGNGLVVVGSSWHDWSVNSHAFRWTTATGMQSVADWLAANGRPVTGWTLERATAVNWNGSVVAGDGTDPNGNAQAWIARINGDTSAGLLGLDDAANSLASTINIPRMGTTLANMALHGAHGHPGEARLVSGKFCTWVNGDWGHSDVYNSNAGLLEAGLCATPFDGYGDPQFGLGIGKTWGSQTLPYNGNVEADGWYVVGDIDVHVGHSPIWATLTGLYGQTDSQVRRGYDNAGSRDSSKGTLPQQALAVRLRGEAREVWHKGPVAVTPYIDFAVIGTRANGYTESGGGFPASFNGRNDTVYDLRYGVIATYALSAKTRFIGDLGGVHWFNGNTPGVTGDVLGLFDFHLPGSSVSNDWVRVTAGIDQKIGPGVAYANITAASRGEDPTYMLAAGFRFAW